MVTVTETGSSSGGDRSLKDSINQLLQMDITPSVATAEDMEAASAFLKQIAMPASGAAKVRTIQDILDEMSDDERAFHDLIVGAAVDDMDLSGDENVVARYNALTDERKDLIDFIVGSTISAEVRHDDSAVDNFLAHFGVKGMKWGVRRSDTGSSATPLSKSSMNTKEGRAAARAKVKSGAATLGEAHLAGLKSTGHRVTNALLGDRTYWKQQAIIAGASVAAVGASFALPAVLPASALGAVGSWAAGTSGVAGHVMVNGTLVSTSALGSQVLTGIGLTATQIGNSAASAYSGIANLGRAIRGNTRINRSYEALAGRIRSNQTAGTKRVNKILNQSGSIRKRNLEHSDVGVDNFLAHFGIRGMKWGVRRAEGSDGTVSTGVKEGKVSDAAQAHAIAAKAKSQGLDSLSNVEMKALITRLKLETQYSEFQKQPSKIEKGRAFVDRQLKTGQTINNAITFINSPAGRLLMATMGSTKGKHAGTIKVPGSKTPLKTKSFLRK